MNRAAGKADAGCERLPLGMQAAEGGEQRGMNIDHPVAPCFHEVRVQYAHEAGKADELDPVLAKPSLRLGRKGSPVAMRDDRGGNAGRGRDTAGPALRPGC